MSKLQFIATTTFGLEASVKRELSRLGYENISALDGRVNFSAGIEAIAEANIWLRYADRLLINMGEFNATSFEDLFEKTKALDWGDFITLDGRFTVTGRSVKSALYSVPDCQAIVKKAIVEKLKQKYHTDWFDETGPEYKVKVSILKDRATLTIDTSGPALHKRGYREIPVAAPLKETMAAALVELSYYKKDRIFFDPFCGSGTLSIEAALIAQNIAPGLSRRFVSEDWPQIAPSVWEDARREATEKIDRSQTAPLFAYDIDKEAVAAAEHNAKLAGVEKLILFKCAAFKNISLPGDYGVLIGNPPYGERIGSLPEVEELYRSIGEKMRANPSWSCYIITSYEDFEKLYGRRADSKRKLFNGNVKTDYYQFYGPRPPRASSAEEAPGEDDQ